MSTFSPWRTFSIFVSSTFADMQAERDYLKAIVFPHIEEELQKRRIKLEIVDLRWGVDTTSIEQEDEREANVLKVCLDEIKRCRPFFIGLLGDRYGWVPTEQRMKDALLGEAQIKPEKGKSVTDLEIEFGVLANSEQLIRSAFYFRESLPYEQFSADRAAIFSDQHSSVLSKEEKAERKEALKRLKNKISNYFESIQLPEKVKTYTAKWDAENEKVTALEAFGNMVMKDILSECEAHAAETWNKVPQNWQEQELALLDAFINHHTHVTTFTTEKGEEQIPTFCGRQSLLVELKQHLLASDDSPWGLVLTGESGSGKSAVFSMIYKIIEKEVCLILAHSAGLSPRAKHVADLLKIWNNLLRKELGLEQVMEETTKEEDPWKHSHAAEFEKAPQAPIEKLQQQFAELLRAVAENKRVVLLIDALDRFEPTGRAKAMSWLPYVMPGNVCMLVTTITNTEKEAVKYHKSLQIKSIDLYTPEEAKEMLGTLSRRHHKSLPAGIVKLILEKKTDDGQLAASSPLWLSLAVNILMAIDQDDFEQISHIEGRGDQQIETYLINLAKGFDPLPGKLFLSLVDKAGQLFGQDFTHAVFDYMAISRNGLREKDFEALLPVEGIVWDPLRFAMLRRWFKAHLVIQGEELQWNLGHSILKNSLFEKLSVEDIKKKHDDLGYHFLDWTSIDRLSTSETMYHMLEAGYLYEISSYFGMKKEIERIIGDTKAFAEWIIEKDNGIETAKELPKLVTNEPELFNGLLQKYVYELDNELAVEGKLIQRLEILSAFNTTISNIPSKSELFENEEFRYSWAVLIDKLILIQGELGNFEEALNYWKEQEILLDKLCSCNPNEKSYRMRYVFLGSRLGSLLRESDLDIALDCFEETERLCKEFYGTNSEDKIIKYNLGILYSKLGDIYMSLNNNSKAYNYFERNIILSQELYDSDPLDECFKQGLASSYQDLGEINRNLGHLTEALKNNIESLRYYQELFEANPLNKHFKNNLAISYTKLGFVHLELGHLNEAHKYLNEALVIKKELCESDPYNRSLKKGLVVIYSNLGTVLRLLHRLDEALNYHNEEFRIEKELLDTNPFSCSKDSKIDISISYQKLGIIHHAMENYKEALKYFRKELKITKERFFDNPRDLNLREQVRSSYAYVFLVKKALFKANLKRFFGHRKK